MADTKVTWPESTEVRGHTAVSITHRATVEFSEGAAIKVIVHERGARKREYVARIIGASLRYVWQAEAGQWVFGTYDSKVTLQRRTVDGWGAPISRLLMDYQDEMKPMIEQGRPKQSPEVTWHG